MLKNRKIITFILGIVAALGVVLSLYFMKFSKPSLQKGVVTVELKDISGDVISEKDLDFCKDDTLTSLLEDNYPNVKIKDGMLLDIDTLTTPDDWSQFICIYVDGEMSSVGISEIELVNKEEISLVMTKYVAQ